MAVAEAGAVSENMKVKKSEETSSPFVSSTAASPITNGSVITSNGNESEATNRNTSAEDSANDDLIDAIIANAVAAVNGEVISAGAMNMCPEAVVSPTEGQYQHAPTFVIYLLSALSVFAFSCQNMLTFLKSVAHHKIPYCVFFNGL